LKVYTQPPKKSKRRQKINPSSVENFCIKNKIDFNNPSNLNNNEEFNNFKELSPDLVVAVAYGQIISKKILETAKFGFINIHASLLPKWRGAAPIQRAIMNEHKKIGVSIMKIEEKLDSGPVLASKEIELDQNAIHGEIEKKLSIMGANLLIKSL
jgi:methionyl-tRNA formyltransferase